MSTITINTVFSKHPKRINPEVYELHEPETEHKLDVVFFHDFDLEDHREAYWKDWTSSDRSHCWPQTWLVEEFPGARVLSVSYDSGLVQTDTTAKVYMHLLTETLGCSLIEKALAGQSSECPVVVVGHGIGGLLMKSLCIHVHTLAVVGHSERGPWINFLNNLKGLFFYATPHLGSKFFSQNMRGRLSGRLLEEITVLSTNGALRNCNFSKLQNHCGWKVYGVGETLETDLDRKIRGLRSNQLVCQGRGLRGTVVEQASAMDGMWPSYSPIPADHIKICKPDNKNAISFQLLTNFIRNILEEVK